MTREAPNLAVLIDSDNAQAAVISDLLAEIAQVGTATVKRAYGDWTTPQLGSWKEVLNVHAIVPVQQFSYTTGKNATDSALIIDAMDLLHGGRVEGFCLVSSDSDFTRLATRIREQGLLVIGFGERKTPKAFVAACDRFLYIDLLKRGSGRPSSGGGGAGHDHDGVPPLKPFLSEAIAAVTQDDGWAPLGMVGSLLQKHDPSFDARSYGFRKLSELVKAQPYLTVKEVPISPGSPQMHLSVRLRGG
ncbi:NYN domain-containing protein [Cyanobium sp. LEGE 06113]|uniref:NYN domain-containing protein n=1 Tax=Cyanobium sp. LEGE 06113 TaxID=1297573 RepID=UPI001880B694|nr:NYN domain-containing protein [Cyanobium sp. LEGE 06113]MBE9152862.1 NYN domain-containing protein [Cyanobium sp. LEGE 06113]MBE9152933.1 NYN domain-containing protein [Cyanobium sp. LEGE 06113]